MQIDNRLINCQNIISISRDFNELQKIISWLKFYDFLDDDTKKYFNSRGALANTLFKKIEKCLRRNKNKILQLNPPSSISYIIELMEFDFTSKNNLISQVSNVLNKALQLEDCSVTITNLDNSTTKEIFHIEINDKDIGKYIIYYFPVLGKIHLPENTPSKCVKTQLIGEQIFSSLLGEDRVAISLYPKIGDLNSLKDFQENFVIQKYLNHYKSLESIIKDKDTREKGIDIFGEVIAYVQKSSFGNYDKLHEITLRNNDLDLLNKYKDFIYLSDPKSFNKWITKESWLSKKINHLNLDINNQVELKIDLYNEFLSLAKRSEKRMCKGSCISQLDLLPRNILINKEFKYKICDFEFVSYSDLAYDLGMAIYGITIQSIRDDYINETKKLTERFIRSYIDHFNQNKNIFNLSIDVGEFISDAYKYAGFLLYGVTNSDYKNRYDKYISFANTISLDYIYNNFKIR